MSANLAVIDALTKSATERTVALTFDGLLRAFAKISGTLDRKSEPVGAEETDRRRSYEAFRKAAVEFRVGLGVLASGPPSIVGALWTYPVHVAALNRSPAQATALLDGFLAVQADGRRGVLDAAVELLAAVSGAVEAYASQWTRPKAERQQPVLTALAAIDDSLVAYVVAVRADLGYDLPKRRSAQ